MFHISAGTAKLPPPTPHPHTFGPRPFSAMSHFRCMLLSLLSFMSLGADLLKFVAVCYNLAHQSMSRNACPKKTHADSALRRYVNSVLGEFTTTLSPSFPACTGLRPPIVVDHYPCARLMSYYMPRFAHHNYDTDTGPTSPAPICITILNPPAPLRHLTSHQHQSPIHNWHCNYLMDAHNWTRHA